MNSLALSFHLYFPYPSLSLSLSYAIHFVRTDLYISIFTRLRKRTALRPLKRLTRDDTMGQRRVHNVFTSLVRLYRWIFYIGVIFYYGTNMVYSVFLCVCVSVRYNCSCLFFLHQRIDIYWP